MLGHSKNTSTINLKAQDCLRIASEDTSRSRRYSVNPDRRSDMHGTEFNQQEMRMIRQKGLLKLILKKLQALIPLNVQPFKIYEEWEIYEAQENLVKITDHYSSFDEVVFAMNPAYRFLSFLQGLNILFFLWVLSVSLVFRESVLGIGCWAIIAVEALCIFVKARLLTKNKQLMEYLLVSKAKEIFSPLLTIIGCGGMMIHAYNSSALSIVTDISLSFILGFVSLNVFKYFDVVEVYAEEQKLIKQLRIMGLFCILFLLAHIFGLMLYSSIYITPEGSSNWIQSQSLLADKGLIVKYIYSVYWAMTTTITVGFGDITPQNYAQVIIVMFVQVCGTSFFGYMISVIGGIVDKRNQKNQQYDNYQETITKLRDHYSLSGDLCRKMKCDIKDKYNKQESTPLKKTQQSQLLEYLDATVRKDFIHQTNIRVIKKSIFFLTYFTTHFQNQIALKLTRLIYKKQDSILLKDEEGKRKMVIINHGKINLFIQKKHNNVSCKKLVRSIETIEGRPTLNVYGYSSLILDKDIPIFANAQMLTSGYELKRQDVLEIIAKNMIDYQNFHQLREKMLISPIKEAIEAPILKDYCYHYTPNIFILSKKQNKKFYQQRSKRHRFGDRKKLQITDMVAFLTFKRKITKIADESQYAQRNGKSKPQQPKSCAEFQSLISVEDDSNGDWKTSERGQERKSSEMHIDQIKIFDHFLKWSNVSSVAAKYEESCKNESYKKRIMSKLLIKQ